jgi:hypothetical protein
MIEGNIILTMHLYCQNRPAAARKRTLQLAQGICMNPIDEQSRDGTMPATKPDAAGPLLLATHKHIVHGM